METFLPGRFLAGQDHSPLPILTEIQENVPINHSELPT